MVSHTNEYSPAAAVPDAEERQCAMEASAEVDRALIARAVHGDERAFEELVAKYMQRAYYIAFGFVGNREDARDQSQEAFVKVYRNLGRYDPTYPFFPWFYKILRNSCFNFLKARKRRPQTSLNALQEESGVQFADAAAGPDALAERGEAVTQLWNAVCKLRPIHHEILLLKHQHQLSYKEIAQALDIPEGTVMSRLFNARKALRDLLEEQPAPAEAAP